MHRAAYLKKKSPNLLANLKNSALLI